MTVLPKERENRLKQFLNTVSLLYTLRMKIIRTVNEYEFQLIELFATGEIQPEPLSSRVCDLRASFSYANTAPVTQ